MTSSARRARRYPSSPRSTETEEGPRRRHRSSISPHARFDPSNPLVPEANPEVLKDVGQGRLRGVRGRLPQPGQVAELRPAAWWRRLVALDAAFGVEDVSVTTFQSRAAAATLST